MKREPLLKKYPRALPIVFLAVIILASYWKLTTMQGYVITDDIFTSDLMNGEFAARHFLSQSLKAGQFPLWIPYIWGGYPFLAGSGACSPVDLILYGLLPPYAALNISMLLILTVAAAGAFLLARELGAGTAGATVAGVSFAYSGFMVSQLKHLGLVGSVCWVPLALYVIERAMKTRGDPSRKFHYPSLMWLGVIFGMQMLNGFIQAAYYSGLLYCAYVLFRLLVREPGGSLQGSLPLRTRLRALRSPLAIWFVIAMLAGVGIGALQLVPMAELSGLSFRAGGVSYEFASRFGYDMKNILNFFYPYANGDIGNLTYTGHSIFWEDYGYIGIVTLVLAVYGVVRERKTWQVRFFGFAALCAYVMVIGPNTPVYEAFYRWFPGMGYFRFPTRFFFVVHLSISILAAIGLTALEARLLNRARGSRPRGLQGRIGFALVALVLVDLLYFQMRQNPIVDAGRWRTIPKTVQRLKEDPGLFRIYSPGAEETHKTAFSMAKGWEGDLRTYIYQRDFIQVNTNVLYGLPAPDGYSGLTQSSVVDIWGDNNRPGLIFKTARLEKDQFVVTPSFIKILSLFNVKYVLLPWEIAGSPMQKVERIGAVQLYENTQVLPRAFMVGRYRLAKDIDSAEAIFLSKEFDPWREAILYTAPSLQAEDRQSGSRSTIRDYRAQEVTVDVSADAPGILVLSDTYYPGWKAEVDGAEQPVLQANLCQRAVAIPAGNHTVRFFFDSSRVKAGMILSACSLLVILAGAVILRRTP